MPITDLLIVSAIVLAFAAFAAVLAWSEHQTRHWRQSGQSVPGNEEENIAPHRTASDSQRELTAA
jgi:hypothetical protein